MNYHGNITLVKPLNGKAAIVSGGGSVFNGRIQFYSQKKNIMHNANPVNDGPYATSYVNTQIITIDNSEYND